MLTNQQAIIAAQTRACARLQKPETKTRNRKRKKKAEHKRNFGG